jgi:hypothetical protein
MIEKPEMIFPCTCMSEGLVVVREEADDDTLDIAFWQFGQVNSKWPWRMRLHFIWHLIKTGRAYTDMVTLSPKVAKHLAHHILYLLDKKKEQDQTKMLVKDNKMIEDTEEIISGLTKVITEKGMESVKSASDLRSEEAFKITKNVKESGSETIRKVRAGDYDPSKDEDIKKLHFLNDRES